MATSGRGGSPSASDESTEATNCPAASQRARSASNAACCVVLKAVICGLVGREEFVVFFQAERLVVTSSLTFPCRKSSRNLSSSLAGTG